VRKVMEIDKWISGYKVRSFPWIDGKHIYFNVQYYKPGQSIEKPPAWDKTVYIVDNPAGQRLLNDFIYSLIEHVAKMQIEEGHKVILTAYAGDWRKGMEKAYKEITGIILSCTTGQCAAIKTSEGTLITSPVEKINMVWDGLFSFETQNSIYTVHGAVLQENQKDDLQAVYNKINTILLNAGVVLDLNALPKLRRGSESRTLDKCSDIYEAVKF
jgi:hypothetical protein